MGTIAARVCGDSYPTESRVTKLKGEFAQRWLGGSNRFTSPLPKGLSLLTNLEILSIWGSDFEENLPPEWAVWVNLTYLNLHGTNLIGNLPSEWGPRLTKLQRLYLHNNFLTGQIPDSWKGMTSLREFRLRGNRLSGPVPSWFSELAKSEPMVDFTCNYLTGPRPKVFNDSTYWDPQYFLCYQLTTASDVYGYGVVLLELITGQHSIDYERLQDYSLVAWVKKSIVEQGIQAVIDPRLGPDFPVQPYKEVAEIAMNCTAFERENRPTMQFIASKLEQILSGSAPPLEHFQPVPSGFKGVSPTTHTTGAAARRLLRDVETELSISTTTVEPR